MGRLLIFHFPIRMNVTGATEALRLCPQTFDACTKVAHGPASSGSGASLGAFRRDFIPSRLLSRFLKKSGAVSTTPAFSATAAAIH
jgi:hypothetical protein